MEIKFIHKNWAYIVSFIIHGMLCCTLYLIKINWTFPVSEFIEIHFDRGSISKPAILPEQSEFVSQSEPEKPNLPVSADNDIYEEPIKIREIIKPIPPEDVDLLRKEISDDKNISENIRTTENFSEKKIADIETDVKLSPNLITNIGTMDSPFQIEGKAALRTILIKTIPQYPPDLQQEAIVKIRFTVLPNGLIGEMMPILKGSDILEKITLDAFKQWQFNPLPPNMPQLPEQGTITFKYILK